MKKIKQNKLYYLTTFGALGLSALFYFVIKLFVKDYYLIGSSFDNYIPFVPGFIYIYMIWYPFEIVALYNIYKTNIKVYIKTIVALSFSFITSSFFFIVFPTTVNRPVVNSYNNITSFITYITFKADTPAINCFPSNHCILCFIIIFSLLSNKNINSKNKVIGILINILIILSTLLVKQHVIYDVLGSLVTSLFSYYILSKLKFFKNIEKRLARLS